MRTLTEIRALNQMIAVFLLRVNNECNKVWQRKAYSENAILVAEVIWQ